MHDLLPAAERIWSKEEIAWRSGAGMAGHLMARGQPVAISKGRLDPLPHQLTVLGRALSIDPVRLLLADEVGLGKTIEAGLIYGELKARRRVERVLVVAPKGIQLQWIAEMRDRFGEEFVLVGPAGIPVDVGINPWERFDRIVCSIDSVKPLRYGGGTDPEDVDRRNRERFERLVEAQWDLVIIDEAHHSAGATSGVARHELAVALARRARHILLLSATPHSGKPDAFARLMSLLDVRFLDSLPLTRSTVSPYIIRTEKRSAVDDSGKPLFQDRETHLDVVPYGDRSVEQRLYEAVSDYVRHGYEASTRSGDRGSILLLLLMQRLASSSTAAILAALERRLAALAFDQQLRFFPEGAEAWGDLSGEEQVAALETAKGKAWGDELVEVEILIDLARRALSEGPDAKARHLLDLLRRIQRDESDPALKALVFTQFTATQQMLLELFEQAGLKAVGISGEMDLGERRLAQDEFRTSARVLVSTDAGGEGINLQFSHIVINYDLPWNPMRIEQRIGRVDRIGQRHRVRAFNLVMENSIDERVLEVFERKLEMILRQLGVDKREDVLESLGSAGSVERMYIAAIADPSGWELQDDSLEVEASRAAEGRQAFLDLLADSPAVTARSTDAASWASAAFDHYRAWCGDPIEDVARLLDSLPEAPPGESIPVVRGAASGLWALWEVRPNGSSPDRDFVALFVDGNWEVRPDIADGMWRTLADGSFDLVGAEVLAGNDRSRLDALGHDYAYRACQDLAPSESWRAPVLVLRLVVKVTS